MVMAKIDKPKFPKPLPPKPIPKTDCFPDKPQLDVGKLKDAIEFAGKDKDKSGGLDEKEFNAGRSLKEVFTDPNKFDRYDGNDDGNVDRKEYHTGKQVDRIKEAITGRLELPKWGDAKLGGKVGEAIKDVATDVVDVGAKVGDALNPFN